MKEIKKLKANFKTANHIANLIPKMIDIPKITLEKLFIPVFKRIYSTDILNLLRHICGNDENSFKSFEERLVPLLEEKIGHLEKELNLTYDKASLLVLKMHDIQQLERTCAEVSIVLMAAYFEDFLKETFAIRLNRHPKMALPFLEKQLRIADLKEFGFDLTKKMGSLVAGKINFQNVEETAKAYNLSFRIDVFNNSALLKKKVTKFFQTRHLIIHNNGKIDTDYIKIVRCSKQELGEKIIIYRKDLIEYKKSLLRIAEHIEKQMC